MYGNTLEPGITASVNSSDFIASGDDSPGTPSIVGEANLTEGTANANEIHAVSRANRARSLFGAESRLAKNVSAAINNGGSPVIAVATDETDASKDLSGLTEVEGTLANPPKEDVDSMTVTVDSTDKTVRFHYGPLAEVTVDTDEVVVNPATKDFKLDAVPSTDGSFDYVHADYQSGLDAVANYDGDTDFVTALKEDSATVNYIQTTVAQMAQAYKFALGVGAVPPQVEAANYTNPFDDSRMQLVVPGRLANGDSTLGAFVGMRSNIGLTTTPINQRLSLPDSPIRNVLLAERGSFIDKNVTPMEARGTSLRVADDLTTVSDDNTAESNIKYGFTRLVVDFLTETAYEIEQPFVGKYNKPGLLGVLEDLLSKEARPLQQSNVIYDLDVSVNLVSPTEAKVVVKADVAEPIRFIDNDFIIGQNLN